MSRPCSSIFLKSAKLLILLAVPLLFGCGESDLVLRTESLKRGLPDETSTNVTITEFDREGVAYILKAARIDRYYERRILNAYQVDITAFDRQKGGSSSLKADSTIVDDARNVIYAHGNVKLVGKEGSISTSRLIWDRNMDEVIAPGQVTLVKDGNVLRGTNLRTNLSIYPTEMDNISAEGFFEEDYLDW